MNGFIAAYSPDGTHHWSRAVEAGGPGAGVRALSVRRDSKGRWGLLGQFQGSVNLRIKGVSTSLMGASTDIFVAGSGP